MTSKRVGESNNRHMGKKNIAKDIWFKQREE
jgi:hypothetical protein